MNNLTLALLDALRARWETAWQRYEQTGTARAFKRQAAAFGAWQAIYNQALAVKAEQAAAQ